MEHSSYEARDARTGVVLARAATAEAALDQACDLLAEQLHASGEGADQVRYELTATALDGGACLWAGSRIYYPGAPSAHPGPAWMARRTSPGTRPAV
jgi:hypothetical protein